MKSSEYLSANADLMVKNIFLAILPFECESKNEELRIYCKAFTSDLITDLSQFRQFSIRYLQNYDNSDYLFKTDYTVKGTIVELKNEIRFNVHLTRMSDNTVVWSYRNKGSIDSIQEVQQELLGKIITTLQQQLDVDLLTTLRRKKLTDFRAYECWLYGIEELKKGTIESDNKARGFFSRAMVIDPTYSLAYSGMSLSYFNEWSCQIWDRWDLSQKGAKEWAVKALELDSENYIANMILGRVLLFEREFHNSEIYLKKSLKLNANDPFTLIQIASSFVYLDDLDEAERLYERALYLNPDNDAEYHPVGSLIFFEKKQFEKSIKVGEKFLAKGWVDFPVILAASYFYIGDIEKALFYWQKYLNAFAGRISRDKLNIEEEALYWMVDISPYCYQSAFTDFWKFISQEKQIEISFNQKEDPINVFQLHEDVWRIKYLGKTIYLSNSKGLADMAYLLKHPGQEIKAEELLGSRLRQAAVDVIDKEALLSIKQRLEEIESLLVDSIDYESSRVESLRREYDQLTKYLTSSIDKKGRIRIKGSNSDKARSAVTQRIKSALKKIEKAHPDLFTHFTFCIKTGSYCCYKPDKDMKWSF